MKHQLLIDLGACSKAVEWASQYSDPQEAWDKCERGDWMLWLVGKLSGEPGSDSRRKLVLAATKCARLAFKYVRKESRAVVRKCYKTAEAWGRGDPGITWLVLQNAFHALAAHAHAHALAAHAHAHAHALAAHAHAAHAHAAAHALAAHAHAAHAHAHAHAAEAAAAYAAEAAYAATAATAAHAAADAAAYAARASVLRKSAGIMRKYYPSVPTRKGAQAAGEKQ